MLYSIYYFLFLLVLVSNLGSVTPFFRDELLAPVLHFVAVDRGERWQEDCNMTKARRSTSFQYRTRVLAMQCGWGLSYRSE